MKTEELKEDKIAKEVFGELTDDLIKTKTMPKLHKKKCVICQKEFMFRTGIAGRHKQIRRNYSVRFPISQTCSKKCHYVYEAVRSGIMKRINKKGIICSTCGFPTEWERNPVFIKDDIFSLMNVEENTCEECGHQTDGYTIKKIEPLLRKFREAGKQEATQEIIEDEIKFLEDLKLQDVGEESYLVNERLSKLKERKK